MNLTATVGSAAVLTAFATSAVAIGGGLLSVRTGDQRLRAAATRALTLSSVCIGIAAIALLTALLQDNFSIAYVANVSSAELETPMKIAAFYSSQAGSLLYWAFVMSVLLATMVNVEGPRMTWAGGQLVAISGLVIFAFVGALAFLASPFRLSETLMTEGQGLNPLLVDRGMLVHPPMLLGGLAATAAPFVLGAAALAAGRVDGAWIRLARPWAVLAWLVLSVGNVLGGWWAYTVLGWGGYWGWDPVENSALLPLLPVTAFLHSIMVQERRGMMKLWNLGLVFIAFALAVFGTFNVRSGLVTSVHSFAQSSVGPYFLVLLGLTLGGSIGLLAWRAPQLRASSDFVSLASREAALVVNNYVLLAIALVVLGGTLFPVFSELIDRSRITVGPAFYNKVVGPLLIALLVLTTLGTLLPWRRASSATLLARSRDPLIAASVLGTVLVALGMHDPFAVAGVISATLILHVTAREFVIGARSARAAGAGTGTALLGLFDRNPRRYGGYLVHLAFAIMAIAVVASNIYQQRVRVAVSPGEDFEVGAYRVTYGGLHERRGLPNGIESEVVASLRVFRNDEEVATLEPGRRFFKSFPGQPSSIVGLHTSLREDVYAFVEGWDDRQRAQLQVMVNPLVAWLWIGAAFYAAGGVIAFLPSRGVARAPRPVVSPATSGARS